MSISATVERYLQDHRITYRLLEHPRSYGTQATAQAAHVAPDHIAKGVLVSDDQGSLLAVIPGDQWLRLDALRQALDRPALELAQESAVMACFGDCDLGSVPPVAAAYGLPAVVDEALTSLADVYIETGDHRLLAHLDAPAFEQLIRGLRRGHFSHP